MLKRRLASLAVIVGQPLWVVFGFGLSALLVILVSGDYINSATDESASLMINLAVGAVVYGLALAIVALVPHALKRRSWTELKALLGIKRSPLVSTVYKVAVVFLLYFAATIAVSLIGQLFFSQWIDFEQTQEIGIDPVSLQHGYQYVLAFMTLVILPPLFEELLFRGYLFGKLRGRFSFWAAAIVSSVTFGLVHGQWNVAIDTFVLGMFLSYLRESTGSIWPAVVLHGLKNGLAFFLLFIARIG